MDDYHGTRVADPYRWLEDADSAETRAWVEAQNALTAAWVATPERTRLRARLAELYDYPRLSPPVVRGGRAFFTFNDGRRNQPVLYVADVSGAGARPAFPDNRPRIIARKGYIYVNGLYRNGFLLAPALAELVADYIETGAKDPEVFVEDPAQR